MNNTLFNEDNTRPNQPLPFEHSSIETPVEEFTSRNPIVTSEETTIEQMKELMKANKIRHLLVENENQITGLVSDRDLRLVECLDSSYRDKLQAKDIMKSKPYSVSANDRLDTVALLMSEKKIGSVIVNDSDGKLLGIFTSTDALNALIEIVRGIRPWD